MEMITYPPLLHWLESHCRCQIKDLAWTWKDDWFPLIFANQKLTENFKFEDLAWTWKDDWSPASLMGESL